MLEITPPSPPPAAAAAAAGAGGVAEDQSKTQTVTEKTNSEPEKAKTTEQKKPGEGEMYYQGSLLVRIYHTIAKHAAVKQAWMDLHLIDLAR